MNRILANKPQSLQCTLSIVLKRFNNVSSYRVGPICVYNTHSADLYPSLFSFWKHNIKQRVWSWFFSRLEPQGENSSVQQHKAWISNPNCYARGEGGQRQPRAPLDFEREQPAKSNRPCGWGELCAQGPRSAITRTESSPNSFYVFF